MKESDVVLTTNLMDHVVFRVVLLYSFVLCRHDMFVCFGWMARFRLFIVWEPFWASFFTHPFMYQQSVHIINPLTSYPDNFAKNMYKTEQGNYWTPPNGSKESDACNFFRVSFCTCIYLFFAKLFRMSVIWEQTHLQSFLQYWSKSHYCSKATSGTTDSPENCVLETPQTHQLFGGHQACEGGRYRLLCRIITT